MSDKAAMSLLEKFSIFLLNLNLVLCLYAWIMSRICIQGDSWAICYFVIPFKKVFWFRSLITIYTRTVFFLKCRNWPMIKMNNFTNEHMSSWWVSKVNSIKYLVLSIHNHHPVYICIYSTSINLGMIKNIPQKLHSVVYTYIYISLIQKIFFGFVFQIGYISIIIWQYEKELLLNSLIVVVFTIHQSVAMYCILWTLRTYICICLHTEVRINLTTHSFGNFSWETATIIEVKKKTKLEKQQKKIWGNHAFGNSVIQIHVWLNVKATKTNSIFGKRKKVKYAPYGVLRCMLRFLGLVLILFCKFKLWIWTRKCVIDEWNVIIILFGLHVIWFSSILRLFLSHSAWKPSKNHPYVLRACVFYLVRFGIPLESWKKSSTVLNHDITCAYAFHRFHFFRQATFRSWSSQTQFD